MNAAVSLRLFQNQVLPSILRAIGVVVLLAMIGLQLLAAQATDDWLQRVHEGLSLQKLDAALQAVEERLKTAPEDLEAHAWRGRLLAWKGRWPEGEAEYQLVLEKTPNDSELLTALADVLLWQKKYQESLDALDRARMISAKDPEILVRRATVLALLDRAVESQAEYRETLAVDPGNRDAATGLKALRANARHEFRVENDTDFFSYTDAAQTQHVTIGSRWSRRWSTVFSANIYRRFGESAGGVVASTALHFTPQDSLTIGGGAANRQDVAPTAEAFFEYGHGFKFANRWVPGLESSYQQHWFWYRGAQVLTLASSNIVYLPKDWTWTISVIGSRTEFGPVGAVADWVPSGWTKLAFPLRPRVAGNLFYSVGSENFSLVDQIGRLSTHTYGGGLRYQFAERQDVTGFASFQDRSHGQTETSFGLSYGIRF